jgi:hypothetical protein
MGFKYFLPVKDELDGIFYGRNKNKTTFFDPISPTSGIVTSGLVLNLDAGNSYSYPGSGTTWYDLSGNGNNGTLTNGPNYSSADGGFIAFDGTNDYVQFSTVSVQTICFWGRMDANIANLAGLVCTSATGDGSLRTYPAGTFPTSPNNDDFHNGYVSSFMINGVSNLSSSNSGFVIPNGRTLQQDFYVGAIGNARNISTISHTFLGRVYKGRVYAVDLYNRQLTNNELIQNFNARKSRYGL